MAANPMTTVKSTNDVPMRVRRTTPSNCQGFTVMFNARGYRQISPRRHRDHRGLSLCPLCLCGSIIVMTSRSLLLTTIAAFACSRASGQLPGVVAQAHDPMLQHHEIRIEQLPKPFDTPSSGNPPSVRAQPSNATLHVPPGFRVSLFAEKLGDPRAMLQAPNGD